MLNSTGTSASALVEQISLKASSVIFLFDLAEYHGFGNVVKEYLKEHPSSAKLVSLQCRSGSGMSIIGRLAQGTSKEGGNSLPLTAFTTPVGLAQMASSLALLSTPTASSRLIIQVANVSTTESSLVLSPSLSALSNVIFNLPKTVCVLLSATPQESIDMAAVAYQHQHHTVHIFDHYSSAREVSNSIQVSKSLPSGTSPKDLVKQMGYNLFDFVGDPKAHTTLVMLNTPLAVIIKSLFKKLIPGLAAIIVRVVRPWDDKAFREALPSTTRNVYILEEVSFESSHSGLFTDVFGTLFDPIVFTPAIHGFPCTPERMRQYMDDPESILSSIAAIIPNANQPIMSPVFTKPELDTKKLLFFSPSHSTGAAALPKSIVNRFISHPKLLIRHISTHDTFSKPGGITVDRIVLSDKAATKEYIPLTASLPLSNDKSGRGVVDFIGIMDQALLKTHSLLTPARPGAAVLVCSTWTPKEVLTNVPLDTLMLIHDRNLRVYLLDPKKLACDLLPNASRSSQNHLETVCSLLAFLHLYVGKSDVDGHRVVQLIAKSFFGDSVEGVPLPDICVKCRDALALIPSPNVELITEVAKAIPLKSIEFNSIEPGEINDHLDNVTSNAGFWHDAAKHIIFREAFIPPEEHRTSEEDPQIQNLRPDIPERTYLVTTKINRRLTPKEYDRNVFHLEFDTTGTGLKYAIGEALGVYGWNDTEEVLNFCNWYEVDPNSLITIPAPGRGNGKAKLMHTRTVLQSLQQQIDIFGKPPKSFYGSLSKYATKREDRMTLYFISSPEGSSTFKKLSEKDTVTYADVLRMYPSAKPPIAELCELIGDIAPRHYSIASSQAVVGDRVDLLVVTVDWMTPSGSLRYGQCTRYLAGLKEGQKVTVSIKPSVMKLPSDPMQPIIMAGLGTGAAPFRAFIQYRAWLKKQGVKVGPLLYYFGSRHRSQEYLYGEEIEAYMADNIITHCGLAFSRDGKRKVYIQHKMKEDEEILVRHLNSDRGVFYLCGPTWPVPDVYETLVGALEKYTGKSIEEAGMYLEGLKEEERYVLEVY